MSAQYNGIPSNIAVPAGVAIASSTDASPIVVTTSAAHGLTTGDDVTVAGHATNTAANGRWVVAVTGATTFSLTGSTGNGVGGATGTAYSLALGATYAEPSDGDARSAASVNVALSALGDRTAMLSANMGRYKLVSVVQQDTADDDTTESTIWGTSTASAINTWTEIAPQGGLLGDLQQGDIVDLTLTGNVSWGAAISSFITLLALYADFYPAGSSSPTWTKMSGSGQRLTTEQAVGAGSQGFCLRGQAAVPAGAQSVQFSVWLWCGVNPTTNVTLIGDRQLLVNLYRPTDFVNRLA